MEAAGLLTNVEAACDMLDVSAVSLQESRRSVREAVAERRKG